MDLPLQVALGTMHGKEAAIAPPFAKLGITLRLALIDTDCFGSFAGDVARAGNMLEAARAKARAAAGATGLAVGLASEGAYGPHPFVPFLPFGQELLLWHDTRSGQEIVEMTTDDRPCYDQQIVTSAAEADAFLRRIGFPATAMILQTGHGSVPLAKGITDRGALDAVLARALATKGSALVQTDMRAHMNPRRMAVIGELAERLARRIATRCPTCAAPGFGRLRSVVGLQCRDCGSETGLIAADVHGCVTCGTETVLYRAGLADPAVCPSCNP